MGVEWSASRPGRALPPGKDPRYPLDRRHGVPPGKDPPVPIGQEAQWAPEPVWTLKIRGKLLPLLRIEHGSPGCPVCSQTLYWLSYPRSQNRTNSAMMSTVWSTQPQQYSTFSYRYTAMHSFAEKLPRLCIIHDFVLRNFLCRLRRRVKSHAHISGAVLNRWQ
jgi:hypothetical protein